MDQMREAYKPCAQWHRENISSCSSKFKSLLCDFPNLDTVRIDSDYFPNHLSGWLQKGDMELLQARHQGRLCHHDWVELFTATDVAYYYDRDWKQFGEEDYDNLEFVEDPALYYASPAIANGILSALIRAKIHLKDFRVSEMGFQANPTSHLPCSALRTLRASVGIWHEWSIDDHADLAFYSSLAVIISNAPKLEDLDLTAVHIGPGAASAIFNSPSTHTRLQRLSLNNWKVNKAEGDSLVGFLAVHFNTLRYLFLTRIYLYGSWRDVLEALAPLVNSTLRLLRLCSFHEFDLTWWPKERDPGLTDADFARFECQVSWNYDGFDDDFEAY
jgi:hypothetical protein